MRRITGIISWIVVIAISVVFIRYTAGSMKDYMTECMDKMNAGLERLTDKILRGEEVNVNIRNFLPEKD